MYLSALSLALNRPGAVSLEQVVASLFANDEQGAWYDPSDYSTMFEDATGLTPISTVEKAVGLIFDKRKGGLTARRNRLTFSEQLDNAAWTPTASTISANTSDTTDPIGTNTAEKYTNTAAADNITRTAAVTVVAATDYAFSIYAKKGTQDWLRLSGWADSLGTTIGFNAWFDLANGQTGSIASGAGGTAVSSSIQSAGNGWYRCIVVGRLTSATTLYPVACMTTADNVATRPATSNVVYLWGAQLDQASSASTYQKIVSGTGGEWTAGNHAYQTGSTARPVLRARYNMLTFSEQFDNAAWTTSNATITSNAAVAPDSTTTADKLIGTGANPFVQWNGSTLTGTVTLSVYAKAAELSWIRLTNSSAAESAAWFNLSTGQKGTVAGTAGPSSQIQSVGNGWYRCSLTVTSFNSANIADVAICATNADNTTTGYTGNSVDGILIWGAQLISGTSAGDYQRIAAATDYATTSTITGQPFRPYLHFDGADGLLTANVDFTSTDAVSMCMGEQQLGAYAAVEVGFELSGNSGNSGAFAYFSEFSPTPVFRSNGGTQANATAPSSSLLARVASGRADISDDVCILRINGAQVASVTTDQGAAASYVNQPLYIGSRSGILFPMSGNIYGLLVRGGPSTTDNLQTMETYMAGKTGVTL